MSLIKRLAPALRSYRLIADAKTLSPRLVPPLYIHTYKHHIRDNGSEASGPNNKLELAVPTILSGLLGLGFLEVTHADHDEGAATVPSLPEFTPASSHNSLEETARREKLRLEELLKSKGGQYGSYPRFNVIVRNEKVTFRFRVPPSCDIPLLITNLVSRLGSKAEGGVGSDMILQTSDSGVAWDLSLRRPKNNERNVGDRSAKDKDENDTGGDLRILIFRPLMSSEKIGVEFTKRGSFTHEELDVLASALQLAGQPKSLELRPKGNSAPPDNKTISGLEAMGVKIYGLTSSSGEQTEIDVAWENIAGYEDQKREIEDTILLALKRPEVYDHIARGTRCKFKSNRPRAVLFEGPPGTGKTSCARVIANQAGVPLLYVPLEIIMSKYYGESERLLGKVFSLANEIPNGAIIFLDEVDSVATARDSETHEATRRLLSVLLRQIDGFEQDKEFVVVAATNRKQDLDPALLSRFDSTILFSLPDHQTRQEIAAQYAKHLTKPDLAELASVTEEMSGRDIRDVCQQAERRWASKIIRGQGQNEDEELGYSLPPLQEYVESALQRRAATFSATIQSRNFGAPKFDFM